MELLHYRIYSEDGTISHRKPVMVFIHGFGGSSAMWVRQIHKLKTKYDLVLLDMPSHGKTKTMLSQMEISYEAVTAMIMDVVDHLKIQKATFVGCSLGTMLVKYIVLTRPERVDKYVLIGPVGKYAAWFRFGMNFALCILPVAPLPPIAKLVARMIVPHKESAYSRNLFLSCAKHIPKKEFICWLKMLKLYPAVNVAYQAVLDQAQNGLYIIGDRDTMFRPTLRHELPRVQHWTVVEQCGHICNLDQPEQINQLIMTFQDTGALQAVSV